jgi:hypothetical protein
MAEADIGKTGHWVDVSSIWEMLSTTSLSVKDAKVAIATELPKTSTAHLISPSGVNLIT